MKKLILLPVVFTLLFLSACAPNTPLKNVKGDFVQNANIVAIEVKPLKLSMVKQIDNYRELKGKLKEALQEHAVGKGTEKKVALTVYLTKVKSHFDGLSTILVGDKAKAMGKVRMSPVTDEGAAVTDKMFAEGDFNVEVKLGSGIGSLLGRSFIDKEEELADAITYKVLRVIGLKTSNDEILDRFLSPNGRAPSLWR